MKKFIGFMKEFWPIILVFLIFFLLIGKMFPIGNLWTEYKMVRRTFKCSMVDGKVRYLSFDLPEGTSWSVTSSKGSYWLSFSRIGTSLFGDKAIIPTCEGSFSGVVYAEEVK